MTPEEDKTLRDSVPDHYKGCTSPIGGVQNYIVELEQKVEALYALLLRIGDKSHDYATNERYNNIDKDSWIWTLRRWCTEHEIIDYLKDRKGYIERGETPPSNWQELPP